MKYLYIQRTVDIDPEKEPRICGLAILEDMSTDGKYMRGRITDIIWDEFSDNPNIPSWFIGEWVEFSCTSQLDKVMSLAFISDADNFIKALKEMAK